MSLFQIMTPVDVQDLVERSNREPVFLLKHSTLCPISAGAYSAYQEFDRQGDGDHPWTCALVRVIEERTLSDQIAERFGVDHASPQLLLISRSKVIWHDSHWRLTLERMNEVVDQFLQPERT